ncbi:MAG: hypothetical protein NXI16_08810 [Alphaproteobacteria bacterium]|nr:hypothetical protein [Alphaproteobacteria bacterium]
MTDWTRQPPRSVVTLDRAETIVQTDAGRSLVAGYRRMLAAAHPSLPDRHALDLGDFIDAVPHLALCAIHMPDQCVYRIVGEELKARIGFNPTGQNYYDLVPVERRPFAQRSMNMVIETSCGFVAEIEQTYSDDRTKAIEAVALPLGGRAGDADGYILFADQEVRTGRPRETEERVLLGANVVRRDLIDLGFGVDESFEDLVHTNR